MLISFVVGTVGLGLFRYGKKEDRPPQLLGGIAMMLYPFFVTSVGGMLATGGAVVAAMVIAANAGY